VTSCVSWHIDRSIAKLTFGCRCIDNTCDVDIRQQCHIWRAGARCDPVCRHALRADAVPPRYTRSFDWTRIQSQSHDKKLHDSHAVLSLGLHGVRGWLLSPEESVQQSLRLHSWLPMMSGLLLLSSPPSSAPQLLACLINDPPCITAAAGAGSLPYKADGRASVCKACRQQMGRCPLDLGRRIDSPVIHVSGYLEHYSQRSAWRVGAASLDEPLWSLMTQMGSLQRRYGDHHRKYM